MIWFIFRVIKSVSGKDILKNIELDESMLSVGTATDCIILAGIVNFAIKVYADIGWHLMAEYLDSIPAYMMGLSGIVFDALRPFIVIALMILSITFFVRGIFYYIFK